MIFLWRDRIAAGLYVTVKTTILGSTVGGNYHWILIVFEQLSLSPHYNFKYTKKSVPTDAADSPFLGLRGVAGPVLLELLGLDARLLHNARSFQALGKENID
jgi:hypothetical protein